MIRTIVVDDEPLARKRLRDLVARHDDVNLVAECKNGAEALSAIRERRPELMFLDVQMPDLDGFGVLATVEASELPFVVFVSAYDEYALKAFETHALDYLLKPFDDERFENTLARVRNEIDKDRARELVNNIVRFRSSLSGKYIDQVPVKSRGRIVFVAIEDVAWIRAAGVYTELHTSEGEHLVRTSLSDLEKRLDPNAFLRIHRSTIVRVDAIAELKPESHGDYSVRLRGGPVLRLSRSYRARLSARLGL